MTDRTFNQIQDSVVITFKKGGYFWRLQANNGGHASEFSPVMRFTVASAGVARGSATTFSLEEAYPNPSNGSSTIRFTLDRSSIVTLSLLDEFGRTVQILVNDERTEAGDHDIALPKLASGVYLCRLEANGESTVRKIVVE